MTTYNKKSSNDRRDERNIKSPEEDTKPPGNKRKDKKKYCRGKVGVEHKPECRTYQETKRSDVPYAKDWRILVCAQCGKELDRYYPFSFWGLKSEPPPPWVDK